MNDNAKGEIIKVSGPLVVAKNMTGAKMYEVVRVSNEKLMGEIVELNKDMASIQVYEETSGIGPGEPVFLTGETMSVELAPGLLQSIFDGIQRPLELVEKKSGHFIKRGIEVDSIDKQKKWDFVAKKEKGDDILAGDILGEVKETNLINHKVMLTPNIKKAKIEEIKSGSFNVEDTIAVIVDDNGKKHNISMLQKWPIRIPRPIVKKTIPTEPLVTGTRILDSLFPLVKGGAAAIPGPFGAGKTVTQQSLAKYCDAQIIIYIGCGERGNEMTDVLVEFPELKDPNTGEDLMQRTVMIANTSNMPVAAREASVYTGITIAEYYRDMGYNVALMADSTSRWAEAMREMSGRLEEMPGEEGYPAYLGSRTAAFYERSGIVDTIGTKSRKGSLTVIGAVSPPGGDLSEPVTQNTLRVTKVFWALDSKLAGKRHFPAINWLRSYSLYADNIAPYLKKNIAEDYVIIRRKIMELLQEEARLEEIVRLVGFDALSNKEKIILETSKMIREDFLFQNAFDPEDAYTSTKKQYLILRLIYVFYIEASKIIENSEDDFDFNKISSLKVKNDISDAHLIKEDSLDTFKEIERKINDELSDL